MAITYPLTMPSSPAPRVVRWGPQSSVASTVSPFTYQTNVYDWGGKVRFLSLEFPPMSLADAKAWQAWILSLNGDRGTFYFSDTIGGSGRGTVAGSPLVNGINERGDRIDTDGWSGGDNVKAGDWISIKDRLYTILEDASESSGAMELRIWPDADASVSDNLPISYGAAARGVFRMTNFPSFRFDVSRIQQSFAIEAVEEIPTPLCPALYLGETEGGLAYISAIETAGATPTDAEKAAIHTLFFRADLTPVKRAYITTWGVEAANKIDLISASAGSAAFVGVNWSHQPGYAWVGVADNGHLNVGETPVDLGIDQSTAHMALYMAELSNNTSYFNGSRFGSGTTQRNFILSATSSGMSFSCMKTGGVPAHQISYSWPVSGQSNTGLILGTRYEGRFELRQRTSGGQIYSDKENADANLAPDVDIYFLAINVSGTPSYSGTGKKFSFFSVGTGGDQQWSTDYCDAVHCMLEKFDTHRPPNIL